MKAPLPKALGNEFIDNVETKHTFRAPDNTVCKMHMGYCAVNTLLTGPLDPCLFLSGWIWNPLFWNHL